GGDGAANQPKKYSSDVATFVELVAASRGDNDFPDATDKNGDCIEGQKEHLAIPEAIPDTVGIMAGEKADQRAVPVIDRGYPHGSHRGIGLESQVIHAVEHGGEHRQPDGNHHSFEVDAIANMGTVLSDIRGRIKNGVYSFVEG